ncbi:type IV secretory system conjugative DNA transfer family protein [Candidatus Peregrinibacteria bacterium]|nr:type IV secretory system conjugative DNA transfer family protein [Candidatus Peregrinibacteria bacterium]
MKYFQIIVPQGDDQKKKESLFQEMLVNFHKTAHGAKVSFEILGYEQYTYFFCAVPDNMYETIECLFYSTYPDCEIKQVSDYVDSFQKDKLAISGARMKLKYGDVYPFKVYSHFEDDCLNRLFSVISKIASGEQVWVQIMTQPIEETAGYHLKRRILLRWNNFKKIFSIRDRMRVKDEHSVIKERYHLAVEKTKIEPFSVSIRVGYIAKTHEEAENKLHAVVNSFYQFNETDIQGFKSVHLGEKAFLYEYKNRKQTDSFIVGQEELATIYHLPNSDIVPHIVHVLAKKSEAPQDLPKVGEEDVSLFGITNYHNNFNRFGFKREDRRRHLYVVGKSGSGKSKLLELLIKEDLENGNGIGVLDPHGDLVDSVMEFVPKDRIKDVIYFDPSDINYPITFNPMESVDEAYKMQVTIGFIQIFKKLFGSNWTDRLEHVLRYTVLALLDSSNTTVLSILKMLTDKNYRQNIVSRIKDNVVKNFWVSEFAGWSEKFDAEAITPLLNKVGQFVATNMIRNIVGQPTNKFDIRDVMDNQKILLMKVSKGLLGEENSSLLGAMIITKMYQAAMSRADIREEGRKEFYFYVDEFQNFATDTFTEILSEARKYRLNLTIAHQYMGQLSDLVKKTVFGNVGSIISFRVGADDAAVLAEEYNPVFKPRDIINLGVREFYCKMSVNGEIREAFSGRTVDVSRVRENYIKEIIDNSRKTYCEPREKVEEMLAKWDEAGEFENGPEEEPDFNEPLI